MRPFIIFFILALPVFAESRSWRSANGNRSFRAEFVSSDGASVKLRRTGNKIVTVALDKLHRDDRAWIKKRLQAAKAEEGDPTVLEGAAFGTLAFGDDRTVASAKLKKMAGVKAKVDERLQGRTGLNGIYQTNLNKAPYDLYFDWTKEGGLREVTLRSQAYLKVSYETDLKSRWESLIELLTTVHGAPVQATTIPMPDELKNGELLGTHLWHLEKRHSVLLTVGKDGATFVVAIRRAAELIPPNAIPAPRPKEK